MKFDILSIPNFCGHEHWGSINAVGGYKPEYNGYYNDIYPRASPQVQTSIWDLVLEPYFEGMLRNAGINLTTGINAAEYTSLKLWWKAKPEAALEYFKTNVEPFLINGTIQCTIKGIEKLYSVQLMSFDLNEWQKADSLVCSNYTGIFFWYQKVMLKANFSGLIRPVQPEFYFLNESEEKNHKSYRLLIPS